MPLSKFTIQKLNKDRKKDIKSFYKENSYSASFIGYDHAYILTLEDKIIGAVIISYQSENNRYALLHGLFIEPSFRNKGCANLLIKNVIREHKHIICFAERELECIYISNGFFEEKSDKLPSYLIKRYESYVKKSTRLSIFINNDEDNG